MSESDGVSEALKETICRLDNLTNGIAQSEQEMDLMFQAINFIKSHDFKEEKADTEEGQLIMEIHNKVDRLVEKGILRPKGG